MQQSRRSTPYPSTWEIPLATATAVTLALVVAAHAGRTLANGVTGHGWAWTPRGQLFTALPGILAGDARAGLPPGPGASAAVLHTAVAAAEILTIVVIVLAVRAGLRAWGPGRIRGMATRAQAAALLGPGRLRRVAPVVRPDLHPTRRRRAAPGGTTPGGVAARGRPRTPRRAAVGAVGPHRRRRSARKGPARPWTCSSPPCSPPPAPPWSPSPRPMTCCCPSGTAPPGTARAWCWTRSGSPRDCPSWSGTRSPGAWTRWSPRSAPRRSPPAPSPAPAPAARATTPPGSTPPRPPRSSRATSTPPP